MTARLATTTCLFTLAAELLDIATMQALMQLDEKLYITVFDQLKKVENANQSDGRQGVLTCP